VLFGQRCCWQAGKSFCGAAAGLRRCFAGAAPGLWRIAAVRRDAAAGLRQNFVGCDGVLWPPVACARIGCGGAVAAVAELNRQQRAVSACNGL
jgi:hypothetical protein